MRITTFLVIFFLFLISIDAHAQKSDPKFHIQIELRMPGGDSTGGLIKFKKHGFCVKTIRSKGTLYTVGLKFNSYYLITCTKKGYTTKVVYFDTHIPKGRNDEAFAKFKVSVNLIKKVNGEKSIAPKLVGGVKYDPEIQDFDKVKN
jgi:hypothetical protein